MLSRTYHLIISIFSLFHFVFGLNQFVSMRDPIFLFIFDFFFNSTEHKQPEIRAPHQLYLASEVFRVCNKWSFYILWVEALLIQASSFGLCQMAWVLKARINPQFHRPGNLKGVAGFKIITELYPYICRSKSPTSSTFSFNRLSKSNVKVHRIF